MEPIQEYIQNIKPEIREVLLREEWVIEMKKINEQFVGQEKKKEFETKTWFLMLGITDEEEYTTELVTELNLTKENAGKALGYVSENILDKIAAEIERVTGNTIFPIQKNQKPLEQARFEKPFTSEPTTKKVAEINKKIDPYLEPIE